MKYKIPGLLVVVALALVAGFGAMTLPPGGPTSASADDNCGCDVTFTKWITVFPNMEGTIGGDVSGSFHGQVLSIPDFTKPITNIEASYTFNARGAHGFTARVSVVQDNTKGTAVINGTVTEGWLKGARVDGQYKVIANCAQAAPAKAPDNLCWQGSLHLTPAR